MGQTRLIAMLAALLLSACGGSSGDSDVAMPDGYTLYPGAEVIDSTTIEGSDGGGTIVVMRANDTPAEVVAFYRREAEATGISIVQDIDSGGGRVIAGESSQGHTFSLNATPDGDTTIVQLVAGQSF